MHKMYRTDDQGISREPVDCDCTEFSKNHWENSDPNHPYFQY